MLNKSAFLLSLAFTCSLCSCSLENETAEKLVAPNTFVIPVASDEAEAHFIQLCSSCILGDMSQLEETVSLYAQSFRERDDNKKRFVYQQEAFNELYERCIDQAVNAGLAQYSSEYMILNAIYAALIARFMYLKGEYAQSNYWIRRIIDLQGRMQGLETAGNLFIRRDETYEIGVKMLAEAAQLGNRQALMTLSREAYE